MSLLIEKLSAVYPILSSVSDCMLSEVDSSVNLVTLASRNNTITVASLIKSSSISTVFNRLAPDLAVPEELALIAQHCNGMLFDLDSISQQSLRFYVYVNDTTDLPWFMDRYKCVVTHPVKQPNLNELNFFGFLIDAKTGILQYYKYYHRGNVYRFTGQTDFLNYSTDTPIYGKNNIPLDRFNLTDFDFTGLTVKHVIRDNADQFYINIVETFDDNIGSFPPSGGGGAAVAPRL